MNKQEAKEQLDKLMQEAEKLKAIIEAPEKVKGHPHVFTPEVGGQFWLVRQGLVLGEFLVNGERNLSSQIANVFRTEEAAQAWADALDVMMEFRVQPGARELDLGKVNWGLDYYVEGDDFAFCYSCRTGYIAKHILSGSFDTKEALESAVKTIGEDRVKAAFKTLAGVV